MTRTLLLAALALAALVAAFLLPRARSGSAAVLTDTVSAAAVVSPSAKGALTLTARPSRHAFQATGDDVDLVFELQAAKATDGHRAPVDFALVLDRSGSMTGTPLDKAKDAAKQLVAKLGADDRLSIIHFGSDARLALPELAMDGAGKERADEEIDRITATGGTNIGQALAFAEQALDGAGRRENAVRRIVLLSDGEANEGPVGAALVGLARTIDHEGSRISALGLGVNFDEDLMLSLADAGGGQYRYLASADEVASALEKELEQASTTAASGVAMTITLPQGVELGEVIGYPTTSSDGVVHVPLSDFAAGELRRVVVRVHARAGDAGARTLARATVDYTDERTHRPAAALAEATAEATNDSSRIAASYDQEAAKTALRARMGQTLNEAANLYQKDDLVGATRTMDEKVAKLQAEARAFGADTFAGGLAEQSDGALRLMHAAPPSSAAGLASTKTLKARSVSYSRH